ncbi:MAG: hypothetical protein IKV39_01610 [Clostridia bacterium]|nr:hypothetical protein [Clostridia bacterium]
MDTSLFVKRLETVATAELTEDFSLPEYQPPIQRVVGVKATPLLEGKYLSGEELELDGCVTYTILYMGEDGSLTQTSQTTSYTASVPVKSEDDRFSARDMVVGYTVEGVNCRVTGPRKFTLSSRVKHNVMSQKPMDVGLKVEKRDGMTASPVLRRQNETHTTASVCEVSKNCEISGEMREREGMKLVMAQGSVAISDVRIGGQNKKEALVKGECFVNVLLCSPEGEYVLSKGRAPIEETVELPEAASFSAFAAAFGNVAMIEIESGEGGEVRWNVEYDIDCTLMRTLECETAADAYLTGTDSTLTYGEFVSYAPACVKNGRLTTSGTGRMRPGAKFICAWGSGTADRCDISGGKMTVHGSVKVSLVTLFEGEMLTDEITLPLKYECEAVPGARDAADGDISRRVAVSVTDIGVRPDGDVANITVELSLSAVALETQQVNAVVGITPVMGSTNVEEQKRNVIRVYVPEKDETPWDVEKRFRLGREIFPEGDKYVI